MLCAARDQICCVLLGTKFAATFKTVHAVGVDCCGLQACVCVCVRVAGYLQNGLCGHQACVLAGQLHNWYVLTMIMAFRVTLLFT